MTDYTTASGLRVATILHDLVANEAPVPVARHAGQQSLGGLRHVVHVVRP